MSALLLTDVDTVLAGLEAEFDGHVLVASTDARDDTNTCGTCTCPCDTE